jgi:hypothetical protein
MLVVGGIAAGLMIFQIASILRLKGNNVDGAGFLLWGIIVTAGAIFLMVLSWVLMWYLTEPVFLYILIFALLAGPVIAVMLTTIGLYQISKSLPQLKKGTIMRV